MIFNINSSNESTATDEIYMCNSIDDNIKLSDMAKTWLEGGNDYFIKTVKIIGNLAISKPHSGTGTASDKYKFFQLGLQEKATRKIIFDFAECTQIVPVLEDNNYYVLFGGNQIYVKNVNVLMENESAHSMIFDNNASYVYCENARIQLTGNKLSCISYTGDFINCVANCTSSDELSVCFHVVSSSILKVFGGEYYAYVKNDVSTNKSVVFNFANSHIGVGLIEYVSCPQVAKTGYKQTNLIIHSSGGYASLVGVISTLTATVNENIAHITNKIAMTKPLLW